jgi:hypothetical protein
MEQEKIFYAEKFVE